MQERRAKASRLKPERTRSSTLQHAWHPPRPCPEERSSHVAAEPLRPDTADGQRHRGDPEMREAARRAVRDDRCGRGSLYLYDLSTALAPRRAYGIGRPRPATSRDGTPPHSFPTPPRRSRDWDRDHVEMRCVRKFSTHTQIGPYRLPQARPPACLGGAASYRQSSLVFSFSLFSRARGARPPLRIPNTKQHGVNV